MALRPGSKPLNIEDLKQYVHKIWNPSAALQSTPLPSGFFDIHFHAETDMRKVLSGGLCTLPQGFFRLSKWQPNFNPYHPKIQSHAQIWI